MTHDDPDTSSAKPEADPSGIPTTARAQRARPARSGPPISKVAESPMFYGARWDPKAKRRVRLSLRTEDPDIARWRAIEWAREASLLIGERPKFRLVPELIPETADRSPRLGIYARTDPPPSIDPGEYVGVHQVDHCAVGVYRTVELRASKFDVESRTWKVETLRKIDLTIKGASTSKRRRFADWKLAELTAESWRREGEALIARLAQPAVPQPTQVLLTIEGVRDALRFSLAQVSRMRDRGELPDPADDGLGREGRIRPRRWCEAEIRQWVNWQLPGALEFRRLLAEEFPIFGGRGKLGASSAESSGSAGRVGAIPRETTRGLGNRTPTRTRSTNS